MYTYIYTYICIYIYIYIYMCIRRFSLIRLPFAHCANSKFSFVRLFTIKTNRNYPFANELNGIAHLCWYVGRVPVPTVPKD